MNKERLLLFTFMQNDSEGKSGMGLDPVTARERWRPGPASLSLAQPRPSGYVLPRRRACAPHRRPAGSEALWPGRVAGMLCLAGGSSGSQTRPFQQAAWGWLPESDWGQTQAWVSGNGRMPLSMAVSAAWEEGTLFQCKRPRVPGL